MVFDVKSNLTLIPNFIKDYLNGIEEMDPCFPSVFIGPIF